MEKIKVLVGDNSGFVRLVMSDILNGEADIQVVDTALDGDELIWKALAHQPDVIIMDIDIPQNYNLFILKRFSVSDRKKIILTGTEGKLNTKMLFDLQVLGIRNILLKPDNIFQPQLRNISEEIIKKVRIVACPGSESLRFAHQLIAGKISAARLKSNTEQLKCSEEDLQIVVIGASSGGPAVIEKILAALDNDFPASVLIAQHIPSAFTATLVNRLKKTTGMNVVKGEKNMKILPGMVIIAPGNANMIIKRGKNNKTAGVIDFENVNDDHLDTPSVDLLMQSAARVYKKNVLGIILSGLGSDGTAGAKAIAAFGGKVIAQDRDTASAYSMARSAIESGYVHKVLSPDSIVKYIKRYIQLTGFQFHNSINCL